MIIQWCQALALYSRRASYSYLAVQLYYTSKILRSSTPPSFWCQSNKHTSCPLPNNDHTTLNRYENRCNETNINWYLFRCTKILSTTLNGHVIECQSRVIIYYLYFYPMFVRHLSMRGKCDHAFLSLLNVGYFLVVFSWDGIQSHFCIVK